MTENSTQTFGRSAESHDEVDDLIANVDEYYQDVEIVTAKGCSWILLKGAYDPEEDAGVELYTS